MKRIHNIYTILLAGSLLMAASCTEKSDVILPNVSMPEEGSSTPVAVTCDQALENYSYAFTVRLDQAAGKEVMGSIVSDLSLVDSYNTEHGTAYLPMPENIFEIPAVDFIIARGQTESNTMRVNFTGTLYGLSQGSTYLLPVVAVIDETVTDECTQGNLVTYIALDVDRELVYTPGLRFSSSSSSMRKALSFGEAVDMTDNTHTFEMRIFPYSWHSGTNYLGTWRGLDRGNRDEAFSGCEIRVQGSGKSNIGNRQCDLTTVNDNKPAISTGEWHTITITCDGAQTGQNSEIAYRLYYDGELIAEAAPTKRFGPASSQRFQVGYSLNGFQFGNTSASYYYDGLIGEIRIWKDCLTQEQIKANLRTVENPSAEQMYAYWKLDEGEGLLLKDSSGNGRDLTFPDGTEVVWNAEME